MKIILLLLIFGFFVPLAFAQQYDGTSDIKIVPIHDAFVAANLSNLQSTHEIFTQNHGDSEIILLWYAFNTTKIQEQILSTGYLTFDLSIMKDTDDIKSAQLFMKTHKIKTDNDDIAVSLYSVNSTDWRESDITFSNRPVHDTTPIATSTVSSPGIWYSWDVTDYVKDNTGTTVSVAALIHTIIPNQEEQVSFYTKDTTNLDNIPYVLVDYETENGGGCLIATATYGTELAPQVQQLRELRDDTILQTESGARFVEGFNFFYYSFSPGIADLERQNPILKEAVRLGITPMISSLSVLNYTDIDSEAEMIGYGIGIILLNLGMYGSVPALVYLAKKRTS